MAEQSIADDLLRNGYDRWERLEGEKTAIGEDLKELFAELKGHGFTPKALRESFRRVRNIADADQQEHDAVVDLYVSSLTGARPAPARVENIEEFPAEDAEVTAQKARLAALRADPAMSIVSVDKLKSQSQPLNQVGQTEAAHAAATSPVESEAVEISTPIQPETADSFPVVIEADLSDGEAGANASEGVTGGESAATSFTAAPVSKYAPKGVITWQHTPPEGVIRHDYSVAFGEAGQDIAVIEDDIAIASSAPIVMIGNVILDGWARYMKARELGIEYPAVQYDGSDSLMDVIMWNVGGRLMSSEQTFRIAQKLSRAEPKRKADIYAAFELGMELA